MKSIEKFQIYERRSCGVNDSEAFVKLEMPVDKQNEETSERYAAFSVMKKTI